KGPNLVKGINLEGLRVLGKPEDYGGRNPLDWKNQIIFIPLTTARQKLIGDPKLTWLNVKVREFSDISPVAEQIENILTQTHRGIKDFRVETMEKNLAEYRKVEQAFTLSLGGVAAISLLIGGIGIMNVMLASISERIREIGIRKAVGARDWDLFVQFVAESVAISFVGGLLGLLAGAGLIRLLTLLLKQSGLTPVLAPDALLIGFVFSVGVGVLSGLYPAIKAARMDPIEALRYE
ncbi:MAG: FtsX-like permease family protein, partial [Lentisphaerota bacterium]